MTKVTAFLPALLGLALLTGCATSPQIGAYQHALRSAGFSAYNQPVGDATNINDWNKYGPGTILRTTNQTYYYPASSVIGAAGVKSAMDPKNASPIGLFSGRRVSGYDFDGKGGWTLAVVNAISGSINAKSDTTVDLQFGKAHLANPLGEAAFHQALAKAGSSIDPVARQALKRGQFACVQNAVWTESIRYTFKQTTGTGASVDYKFSTQEVANLTAKGYKVIDSSVEVDSPTFIAYTPLPNPGQDVPANR